MFNGCSALEVLDLSSFVTNKDLSTFSVSMFAGCGNLKTIYVNENFCEFKTSMQMFKSCLSLVGGKGTKFDPNHIDSDYARIDQGAFNPGYFTSKDPAAVTMPNDGLLLNNPNAQAPETQEADPQAPVNDPEVNPTPTESGGEGVPAGGEAAALVGVPLGLAALGFRRRISGNHVKIK